MMGLKGAENKKPTFLSGGMRQRVGLARAFAVQPKVMLLDEPFAQIDALTRGVIQEELVRMWSATQHTVFMVTHDVDEAILLSDRIALMTNSPAARLAESFAVNLPRPRTREAMIDTDEYTRLRSHILHFLMRGSHALATPEAQETEGFSKACRHYQINHYPEEECTMITRTEATDQILAAKKAKGLTFEAIAAAVGRHKVWVTAALMGQATMSADEATAAARVLGLGPEVAEALQEMPMKGSLDSTVPVDPLIYRFHEITQVYGTTKMSHRC
jgi:cyanase